MIRLPIVNLLVAVLAIVPFGVFSQETGPDTTVVTETKSWVTASNPEKTGDSADVSEQVTTLPSLVVTASAPDDSPPAASSLDKAELKSSRSVAGDSAQLLQDIPGMNLHGAGGISSLPVLHGLADERLNIQVDGINPQSSCPNHMNSALSYINPTKVDSVTVFSGIAPVSAGGDSIGGTIQVDSAPPKFSKAGEGYLVEGEAGTFNKSNGNVRGYNFRAMFAGEHVSLTYDESESQADNYEAGKDFKPAGRGGIFTGEWLNGDVVGSSAYDGAKNQDLGLAVRGGDHLLQLKVGKQRVDFEGFPNQRMDMTDNDNTLVNLRYTGQYDWGELDARIFDQDTDHEMNMGPDRFPVGGMPMKSEADARGVLVQGDIDISDMSILRLGAEYQTYDLDDWWPAYGDVGMMAPDAFLNINDGERDRYGVFGEWEMYWDSAWTGLLGVRSDTVRMDTGDVQGYNDFPIWEDDAAAFNALDHEHTDHHWGLSALVRYEPDVTRTFEVGFARKTRSPNLHERYTWSTQPMASLMNNFVGDGNSYVGDNDLEQEVAHTLSVTGDWRDASRSKWSLKATGYLTYVEDYIDARRCDFGQCGGENNVTATTGFVNLQYVNQSARLYGLDISGQRLLGSVDGYGSFTGTGMVSYVRGDNRDTNDYLYNIMPLNAKISLKHKLGGWSNSAEVQLVSAKNKVSHVRNEVKTSGYGLLNLHSSYEWKHARFDIGVENVFDRFYSDPLGGAYLGQGLSMGLNNIPWGVTVPGRGRSVNVSLSVNF